MNTTFLLYLFTRLDAMHSALGGLIFLCVVGGIVLAFIMLVASSEGAGSSGYLFRLGKRVLVGAIFGFVIGGVVKTVLPTSKDLAIIVGGTVLVSAATSPAAQEMSEDLMKLVRLKLKEAVADVEESASKRKK